MMFRMDNIKADCLVLKDQQRSVKKRTDTKDKYQSFQISYLHYIVSVMEQQPRALNQVYAIFDDRLLGKGSTGNVYLGCQQRNPDRRVAIKSINLTHIDNEVTRYLLSCEIAALNNLGKLQNTAHENIVRLLEIVIVDNFIYLVMELLEGGTLADYIKRHPEGLPEQQAMCIFRQILQGYSRIKDRRIVHRDLKPDNVLFKTHPNESKAVAIIDFGYCEMAQVPNRPKMFYNVGSPKYMSPQAYRHNGYSEKSDIWAMGVMLYEMLIGRTCDHGMTMEVYLQMLERKGVPLPGKLKTFHRHLLVNMLSYRPESRFNCEHALSELSTYQRGLIRQSSQVELRNTVGVEELRPVEVMNGQRFSKNNGIFHSLILPQQSNAMEIELDYPGRVLKSESKVQGQNENGRMGEVRPGSFHIENKSERCSTDSFEGQEILGRVENVDLTSVRQIIHRKQFGDQPIRNVQMHPQVVKQQYMIQRQLQMQNQLQMQLQHRLQQQKLQQQSRQPHQHPRQQLQELHQHQQPLRQQTAKQLQHQQQQQQPIRHSQQIHLHRPEQYHLQHQSHQQLGNLQVFPGVFKSVSMIPTPKHENIVMMKFPAETNNRINGSPYGSLPLRSNGNGVQVNNYQLNHPQLVQVEHLTDRPQYKKTVSKAPFFLSANSIPLPQNMPQEQRARLPENRVNIIPDLTISRAPPSQRPPRDSYDPNQQIPISYSPGTNLYESVKPVQFASEKFSAGDRPFQPIIRPMIQLKPNPALRDSRINHVRLQPQMRQFETFGMQPPLTMLRQTIIK